MSKILESGTYVTRTLLSFLCASTPFFSVLNRRLLSTGYGPILRFSLTSFIVAAVAVVAVNAIVAVVVVVVICVVLVVAVVAIIVAIFAVVLAIVVTVLASVVSIGAVVAVIFLKVPAETGIVILVTTHSISTFS